MAYALVLDSDAPPSKATLAQAVEDVVAANVGYFIAEWTARREPACCLGCADVRYVPDEPGTFTAVLGARQVLRAGQASCQSAAAYSAGYERAKALWSGMPEQEAARRYYAELESRPRADAPGGYYHVLVVKDGEIEDVTEEMPR